MEKGFRHCDEMGHWDAPVLSDKAELIMGTVRT